jgi:hypothetical protein
VLGSEHGPTSQLVRRGASGLTLGATINGAAGRSVYAMSCVASGEYLALEREHLDWFAVPEAPEPLHVLARTRERARVFRPDSKRLEDYTGGVPDGSLLAVIGAQGLTAQRAFRRNAEALTAIEYHAAIDVRPLWQQRRAQVRTGPRWPNLPAPALRVADQGENLTNALLTLYNQGGDAWDRLLSRAGAAWGGVVERITFHPSGAGQQAAHLKLRGAHNEWSLEHLSEGQIAYLVFLAAVELGAGRSLLVLDEPDLHLHPELAVSLVQVLEAEAEQRPVLVATHSDRFLDGLSDPVRSVVLVDRDAQNGTTLRRPDRAHLEGWLEKYRGFGQLRAEGYERQAFDAPHAEPVRS